ncbi:MAG: methylenetetrahydrofolate--tRNA-(uracil(54)-C(5))-methyltransferase (FADH(2)-oxidizing) TrmFO [Clostridia bacterium]|nr:methylenetetrahydrofolate--tRNA-(uracil(54)-C(5))-methyltransferase (FADH(2)-oxidizing) TrmFO [Clostridia bacterium]
MTENVSLSVIGAGLAGCEAAWQAASLGCHVTLYEMKPGKYTPAHKTPGFAELVCSNSLRSAVLTNAVGLLKEEMRRLGSLIMEAADRTSVPAGSALAVDRTRFSAYITDRIRSNPRITVVETEVTEIPTEGVTVIATGPLTSDSLAEKILALTGTDALHFFDAAAPIVSGESINYEKAFFASRYGKGEPEDYLNCPMTKEEYEAFYQALVSAEVAELHDFETGEALTVFEGCMPVEVMAARGIDTLRFGPMKPVGLPVPSTGRDAYATVQLRRENRAGDMYNLVGFQTHLTFGEQKRVFQMIPGLENAEFYRYGVMHRNTYLRSPVILSTDYSMRENPSIFFAGQMTGVEGYVESTGSGLVAGLSAAARVLGLAPPTFPRETMLGAMAAYISDPTVVDFQPMNANFGIIPPLDRKVKGGKSARNEAYANRSLLLTDEIVTQISLMRKGF